MSKHPNRKARCPECGKIVSAYVQSGWSPSVDGPQTYIFRSHSRFAVTCEGWARRVPDDAFLDGQPNIDGGDR